MDRVSIGGVDLKPILDTRRKKQDGAYPVRFRITYQRKQEYYPAGIDLTENEWLYLTNEDAWKEVCEKEGRPKIRPTKELKNYETLIHTGFQKIETYVIDLCKSGTFTLDELKNRMKGGLKNSVLDAFEAKIQKLEKNDQIGTASYYRCAMKCIKSFTQKDIKYTDITTDWLRRLEKQMLKDGKSYTTIGMYMIALRAILNEAKNMGVINAAQYPFTGYKIPKAKGRKMALTVAQIKQIIDYRLSNEMDTRCRDLWIFSYLCNGINMNDLLRLRRSDIQDDEICYYRMKTVNTTSEKVVIRAAMLPEMQRIIDLWGGLGEYLFPGLEKAEGSATEQRRIVQNTTRAINEHMKTIGEAIGLGPISTYHARHSFATVLKRSGASIAYISESLGHTSLATTANYLDSFEKGERAKNATHLVNYEDEQK